MKTKMHGSIQEKPEIIHGTEKDFSGWDLFREKVNSNLLYFRKKYALLYDLPLK